MDRRHFLQRFSYGAGSVGLLGAAGEAGATRGVWTGQAEERRLPYKFGIRQASLRNPDDAAKTMVANFDTFKVARDIPGILGVELQVTNGNPNMRDLSVARRYKAEAHRWGLEVPTTAGVWSNGIWSPHSALDLLDSLRASEILGARVMLVAFFGESAPNMTDEASYGPVVTLLKSIAPKAEEAGIILGLENSLSPAENKTLVELVAHPAVKVYYDLDNMYRYGHGDAAVPGIALLGKEWLAAIHAKNETRLLQEPGRIDWGAAFDALTAIEYDGWVVFETQHESHAQCVDATQRNIAFAMQHYTPPRG